MPDDDRPDVPYGPGHPKPTKPGMAWCNGCKPRGRWRKLEQFRRNNAVKVGIRAQCRECVAAYEKEYRRGERERLVICGMKLAVNAILCQLLLEGGRGSHRYRSLKLSVDVIDDAIATRAGRSVTGATQTALLKSLADTACPQEACGE